MSGYDRWREPAEPSWAAEPTHEWRPQFPGQRYPGDIGIEHLTPPAPRGRATVVGRAEVRPISPAGPGDRHGAYPVMPGSGERCAYPERGGRDEPPAGGRRSWADRRATRGDETPGHGPTPRPGDRYAQRVLPWAPDGEQASGRSDERHDQRWVRPEPDWRADDGRPAPPAPDPGWLPEPDEFPHRPPRPAQDSPDGWASPGPRGPLDRPEYGPGGPVDRRDPAFGGPIDWHRPGFENRRETGFDDRRDRRETGFERRTSRRFDDAPQWEREPRREAAARAEAHQEAPEAPRRPVDPHHAEPGRYADPRPAAYGRDERWERRPVGDSTHPRPGQWPDVERRSHIEPAAYRPDEWHRPPADPGQGAPRPEAHHDVPRPEDHHRPAGPSGYRPPTDQWAGRPGEAGPARPGDGRRPPVEPAAQVRPPGDRASSPPDDTPPAAPSPVSAGPVDGAREVSPSPVAGSAGRPTEDGDPWFRPSRAIEDERDDKAVSTGRVEPAAEGPVSAPPAAPASAPPALATSSDPLDAGAASPDEAPAAPGSGPATPDLPPPVLADRPASVPPAQDAPAPGTEPADRSAGSVATTVPAAQTESVPPERIAAPDRPVSAPPDPVSAPPIQPSAPPTPVSAPPAAPPRVEEPPATEPSDQPVAEEPREVRPADPELALAAFRWRLHPETLREQAPDPRALREVREGLTGKLGSALDNRSRARLLSLRSVASRILGDLDDAVADARLALTYAEATGELRRTALARARLAEVLRWRGEHAEADRLFVEANSPELPDRLRSALHEHAGRSCYDQGRLTEACLHFERALDLRQGEDAELNARTEVALDAVAVRASADGFGPKPRTREGILGGERYPVPTFDEERRLWGYTDAEGNLVVDHRYAEAQPFREGMAWARRPEASRWTLIDTAGVALIEANNGYRAVGSFSDGLAWVSMDGKGNWMAIDPSNIVKIPPGFEDVRPFRGGLAAVRRGGWGAIDRTGQVVVPTRYHAVTTALADGRYVDGFTDEGLAGVELAGRRGVVDRAGRVLVEPAYTTLVVHPVAFLIGDGAGRWGALDRRGEPLIDPVHPSRAAVVARIDRLLADTTPVL